MLSLAQARCTLVMPTRQCGFTLLEVLITIVILAIGLMGLVNLQTKLHMTEMESYQRAQAVILLQDFSSRLQVGGTTNSGTYVTGTGDGEAIGNGTTAGDPDENDCVADGGTLPDEVCDEWRPLLLGASETKGGSPVGTMIGARACVEELVAPNPANGSCTAGEYRITVAWQGLYETVAPDLECGKDLYGPDGLRRVVSAVVKIGVPKCI